jgi:hypothetical protein
MMLSKVKYSDVKYGEKVMPPAREVNLWMKRSCAEKGLPLSALLLTVAKVIPGAKVDKGGPWVLVEAFYTQEFSNGRRIKFFIRPQTDLLLETTPALPGDRIDEYAEYTTDEGD